MSTHLHIVCLDVPYPPDYGCAIDMFYKLMSLHESGVKIHLHYFSYNQRGTPNELNQYCESIHVYERKTGHKGFSFGIPYIVASRINTELIENLSKDNYPVLLEGIHCSGIAKYICDSNRKVVVRLHTDESAYYQQLATAEMSLLKKIYCWNESRLLKSYQYSLPENCTYAPLSQQATDIFREQYHVKNIDYLPAFIPFNDVLSGEGTGNFCLYHGNLSNAENEKAATWLLTKVFGSLQIPLVIAGKNPPERLKKLVEMYEQTCLVENPTCREMNDLVQKAQIQLLPSFTEDSTRLKLLQAVFAGKHCITNDAMVKDSGVEAACHTANDENEMASLVKKLFDKPFTHPEIELRKNLMKYHYNNKANAARLMTWLS